MLNMTDQSVRFISTVILDLSIMKYIQPVTEVIICWQSFSPVLLDIPVLHCVTMSHNLIYQVNPTLLISLVGAGVKDNT